MTSIDFGSEDYNRNVMAARTCCIEVALHPDGAGSEFGTGFLIGPDLILTCYHVVKHLFVRDEQDEEGEDEENDSVPWAWPEDVSIIFDRRTRASNSTISKGLSVGLHPSWDVAASRSSEMDYYGEPKLKPPKKDELDYAILRLAVPVGVEQLRLEDQWRERGWIEVSNDGYSYKPNEEMKILHYPVGSKLEIAKGRLLDVAMNDNGTRIYYRTEADYGSSGAPCFNEKWAIIAIHRARLHDDGLNNEREGIPISAIANHQQALGSPIWVLANESHRRLIGNVSSDPPAPTIDELIAGVYLRFDHVPQRNLQILWEEVRESQLPDKVTAFRIWLQALMHLRVNPDHQDWVFACLEIHLGVNDMNHNLSAFSAYSPYQTTRFIYGVIQSLTTQFEQLKHFEANMRQAPPDIMREIIFDCQNVTRNLEVEVLQSLGFFVTYDLRIAVEVAANNKSLIQCMNRFANGLRRAGRYSPKQRSRGTVAVFQISDDLLQLENLVGSYIDWLRDVADEAESRLQIFFSPN